MGEAVSARVFDLLAAYVIESTCMHQSRHQQAHAHATAKVCKLGLLFYEVTRRRGGMPRFHTIGRYNATCKNVLARGMNDRDEPFSVSGATLYNGFRTHNDNHVSANTM